MTARNVPVSTPWAVVDRPYSPELNTVGAVYDRATLYNLNCSINLQAIMALWTASSSFTTTSSD